MGIGSRIKQHADNFFQVHVLILVVMEAANEHRRAPIGRQSKSFAS